MIFYRIKRTESTKNSAGKEDRTSESFTLERKHRREIVDPCAPACEDVWRTSLSLSFSAACPTKSRGDYGEYRVVEAEENASRLVKLRRVSLHDIVEGRSRDTVDV